MKVKVNTSPSAQVIGVGIQGPSGISAVSQASDVDTTQLDDGSVLVYKANTNKWTSTKILDSQDVEAGEF